jgi:TonB family protein
MKTTTRQTILVLALLSLGGAPVLAAEAAVIPDRLAIVVSTVTPAYPYLMRRAEGTAEVTVSFTVNSKGSVTKASVLRGDNPEFNAAALDAIKKWTFTPAAKDGRVVDTRVQQTFKFSVVDQHKPSGAPLLAAERSAR